MRSRRRWKQARRTKQARRAGAAGQLGWERRFTRPKTTLAALRQESPTAWTLMQRFIAMFIDQNPEWVREAAQEGVGREHLHELVERMVDYGLVRFVQHGKFFRVYAWNPQTNCYEPAGN